MRIFQAKLSGRQKLTCLDWTYEKVLGSCAGEEVVRYVLHVQRMTDNMCGVWYVYGSVAAAGCGTLTEEKTTLWVSALALRLSHVSATTPTPVSSYRPCVTACILSKYMYSTPIILRHRHLYLHAHKKKLKHTVSYIKVPSLWVDTTL